MDDLTKAAAPTEVGELGTSGLPIHGGVIEGDFLRALQGQRGLATYREMADNDAVIGGILLAIEMLFRSVDWTVTPADTDNQAAIDEAEFVASCMNDMSHSWDETIAAILSMLVYGFSLHEIVYKKRAGDQDDGTSSQYDDGRLGWRKLPIRAQNTITEWKLDDNGGIISCVQQDVNNGKSVTLPIDRCLLFRTSTKQNNPVGRSCLRNAYLPWYYGRRIQEIEAIGIERDLAGLPIAYVPPQMLSGSATTDQRQALDEIKHIIRNVRRDEQEGIVFPLAYDENNNLQYKMELLSTGGARQFDTNEIVARYDARKAMTLLADFILLGHEKVGTQALSVSKISLFTDSIAAWLESIADVFNQYAIPRLMKVNGIDPSLQPTLTHSSPRRAQMEETAQYVSSLVMAGAIGPDPELEEYLRDLGGLPHPDDEDV